LKQAKSGIAQDIMKNIKEILIGAVSGVVVGYIIDKYLFPKSTKKNLVESSGEQVVQFTISNPTASSQTINLFDSYIDYVNPNVSISPSMQTFNTYLPREPMRVKSIQVQSMGTLITEAEYLAQQTPTPPTPPPPTPMPPPPPPPPVAPQGCEGITLPEGMDCETYLKYAEAVGLTQPATAFNGKKSFDAQNLGNGYYLVKDKQNAQANQPFQKVCTDASGNENKDSITPTISPYQRQQGNTIIEPKNLILDGKCYLTYTILPKQYLIINMKYEEYEIKP
jgi:hypothetical protein